MAARTDPPFKICIVSSCGGHLTEVRALREEYGKHEHFYVLNDRALLPPDMEGRTRFIRHSERDWLTLVNLWEAFRVLRAERPGLILSTGAGPVVPFSLVGRVLGIPTVFIETFARVVEPSLTGKIMYRLADRFFYQWESLRGFFPKAVYAGPVFEGAGSQAPRPFVEHPFVFVTVGNATQGFARLLRAVDELAGTGFFAGRRVFLQTGNTEAFRAEHCEAEAFLPMERFADRIRGADVVVSHGGAGTLLHVLGAGKVPVVMPRRLPYGEHVDDHQVELVEAMGREGRVIPAPEPADLPSAITAALERRPPQPTSGRISTMRSEVARAIETLARSGPRAG